MPADFVFKAPAQLPRARAAVCKELGDAGVCTKQEQQLAAGGAGPRAHRIRGVHPVAVVVRLERAQVHKGPGAVLCEHARV